MSRHRWYTLSGLLSRSLRWIAYRNADAPSEIFMPLVAMFGVVEIFGVWRGARLSVKHVRALLKNASHPRRKPWTK